MSGTIPVIDFSKWLNASNEQERQAVAKELIHACQTYGFAYILNHGIPQSTIDRAFQMSEKLFSLTHEEKMQAPHPFGYAVHRGYSYVQQESVGKVSGQDSLLADYKETFEIGNDENPEQPNQWYPEQTLPGFREWGLKFYWECHRLARQVLTAIGLGIGLDDAEELLQFHSGLNNQLRLAHYPSAPASVFEDPRTQRCAAHCDFSTLTLLFQDDGGGLEVANPFVDDGSFIEATPVKGACVMNVGDLLMRWSNDTLKSTPHRVGLPRTAPGLDGMTKERFSIPYFVSADPDTVVRTFPQCISEKRPGKYPAVTASEYYMAKGSATYDS